MSPLPMAAHGQPFYMGTPYEAITIAMRTLTPDAILSTDPGLEDSSTCRDYSLPIACDHSELAPAQPMAVSGAAVSNNPLNPDLAIMSGPDEIPRIATDRFGVPQETSGDWPGPHTVD